jgi:hypothetical protein
MRVTQTLNKANAHIGDLAKVAGASVVATLSPYLAVLASVDGTVVWVSLILKLGVPLLAFIYTGMKIYYLWKNKGE